MLSFVFNTSGLQPHGGMGWRGGGGGRVTPYIKVYRDVPQVWVMFSHLLMCNNDYGVNIGQALPISVFNRKFPEPLGTSKLMVKFQYLVHKSCKR